MLTRRDSTITLLLLASAGLLAVTMGRFGWSTWLEAASFITGAVCVWLTVKQSIWNFPLGLVNVSTYGVVFYQSRLLADAGLQVVYFVLGVVGWYYWCQGGATQGPLRVTRASVRELTCLGIGVTIGTLGLWHLLANWGGSASFWDALTTSMSLASQWLLTRKRWENWIGWIVVDMIYIPLYLWKHLYLTAILYAIFLLLAVMGLRAWYASWANATDRSD